MTPMMRTKEFFEAMKNSNNLKKTGGLEYIPPVVGVDGGDKDKKEEIRRCGYCNKNLDDRYIRKIINFKNVTLGIQKEFCCKECRNKWIYHKQKANGGDR